MNLAERERSCEEPNRACYLSGASKGVLAFAHGACETFVALDDLTSIRIHCTYFFDFIFRRNWLGYGG
jgi:hypothetical protein